MHTISILTDILSQCMLIINHCSVQNMCVCVHACMCVRLEKSLGTRFCALKILLLLLLLMGTLYNMQGELFNAVITFHYLQTASPVNRSIQRITCCERNILVPGSKELVSNWILVSHQPRRVTSGWPNSVISKCTFQNSSHKYSSPSTKYKVKCTWHTNIKHRFLKLFLSIAP